MIYGDTTFINCYLGRLRNGNPTPTRTAAPTTAATAATTQCPSIVHPGAVLDLDTKPRSVGAAHVCIKMLSELRETGSRKFRGRFEWCK